MRNTPAWLQYKMRFIPHEIFMNKLFYQFLCDNNFPRVKQLMKNIKWQPFSRTHLDPLKEKISLPVLCVRCPCFNTNCLLENGPCVDLNIVKRASDLYLSGTFPHNDIDTEIYKIVKKNAKNVNTINIRINGLSDPKQIKEIVDGVMANAFDGEMDSCEFSNYVLDEKEIEQIANRIFKPHVGIWTVIKQKLKKVIEICLGIRAAKEFINNQIDLRVAEIERGLGKPHRPDSNTRKD